MNVDWSHLDGVVPKALQLGEHAPASVRAVMDQTEASLRDRLRDGYGLDLDDGDVVYNAIVWHGLIFSQLEIAHLVGLLDANTFAILGGIFRANMAQLAGHAPAEART